MKVKEGLGLVIVGGLLFLVLGCSSSVKIYSEPEGADAYVDGQYIGKTPAGYSDSAIVGTSHNIEIKMEGYKPTRGQFSRTSEFNTGACVGGRSWRFLGCG